MVGGADVADLVGEMEALAIAPALAGSTSDGCSAHTESLVSAMDVFTKLFGNLLAFVYHCFDKRSSMCSLLRNIAAIFLNCQYS
jgi:hypothetical protein